jgi:hypothetical protein
VNAFDICFIYIDDVLTWNVAQCDLTIHLLSPDIHDNRIIVTMHCTTVPNSIIFEKVANATDVAKCDNNKRRKLVNRFVSKHVGCHKQLCIM